MKLKVKLMGVVALINIALNFVFIPMYGAVGAAVTTVFSNVVLLVFYYYATETIVFKNKKIIGESFE